MTGDIERVRECEIHRHISTPIPPNEQNVRWAFQGKGADAATSRGNDHLCLVPQSCLLQDITQLIPEGMVSGNHEVFLTSNQMVPEGIQGLAACRTWGKASTYRQHGDTQPKTAQAAEVHVRQAILALLTRHHRQPCRRQWALLAM